MPGRSGIRGGTDGCKWVPEGRLQQISTKHRWCFLTQQKSPGIMCCRTHYYMLVSLTILCNSVPVMMPPDSKRMLCTVFQHKLCSLSLQHHFWQLFEQILPEELKSAKLVCTFLRLKTDILSADSHDDCRKNCNPPRKIYGKNKHRLQLVRVTAKSLFMFSLHL